MPPLMDGSSEFPSRPEMEQGLIALRGAHRPARPVRDALGEHVDRRGALRPPHLGRRLPREGPRLRGRRRRAAPARRRPASSSPRTTPTPGPRSRTRASASSSSASRTPASSWRPACSSGPAPSSSRRRKAAQLSVNLHSLDGVRARYIQPWEDAQLGGGVFILNASIERLERTGGGITVHTRRSETARRSRSRSTRSSRRPGFTSPLRDLEALGVSTFGRSGWPSLTNAYESATVPGVCFAGTIGAGRRRDSRSTGSRRTPVPSTATATTTAFWSRSVVAAADRPRARAAGGRPRARRGHPARGRVHRTGAVAPEVVPRAGDLARPGRALPRRRHRLARRLRRFRRTRRCRDHGRDRRRPATSIRPSTSASEGVWTRTTSSSTSRCMTSAPMVIGASSAT